VRRDAESHSVTQKITPPLKQQELAGRSAKSESIETFHGEGLAVAQ
jgi:hypothetical protein